jgi:hypothetical protein
MIGERHLEKPARGVYNCLDESIPYDHQNPTERYGILVAKFTKPAD